MKGSFGDADHRGAGVLACRQQAGVAETGDDVRVDLLFAPLAHFFQHAQRRDRLIEMAFDGHRAIRRTAGDDLCAWARHGLRGQTDLVGHGFAGIGVDHLNTHRNSFSAV